MLPSSHPTPVMPSSWLVQTLAREHALQTTQVSFS